MIETERLLLRHPKLEDAKDIFEYAQDKDTGPMAGWPPHKTIEDTKLILNNWLDPNCKEEVFVIVYKPANKVVGTMGVVCLNEKIKDYRNIYIKNLIDQGLSVYEIGNVISKEYWGTGLSTECLKNMIGHIFETTNADMVITCHYAENLGSKRVQEKNGMKVLDIYQREKKWWNTECDTMVVRGKTREEWETENVKEV